MMRPSKRELGAISPIDSDPNHARSPFFRGRRVPAAPSPCVTLIAVVRIIIIIIVTILRLRTRSPCAACILGNSIAIVDGDADSALGFCVLVQVTQLSAQTHPAELPAVLDEIKHTEPAQLARHGRQGIVWTVIALDACVEGVVVPRQVQLHQLIQAARRPSAIASSALRFFVAISSP